MDRLADQMPQSRPDAGCWVQVVFLGGRGRRKGVKEQLLAWEAGAPSQGTLRTLRGPASEFPSVGHCSWETPVHLPSLGCRGPLEVAHWWHPCAPWRKCPRSKAGCQRCWTGWQLAVEGHRGLCLLQVSSELDGVQPPQPLPCLQ